MDEKRVVEKIGQEAEPGHETRPSVALGRDLEVFDFEQVAGVSAFDKDRPGQRMDHARIHAQQVGGHDTRANLAVGGFARLDRGVLQRFDFEHRRDIGMPAVVSLAGLVGEPLAAVNRDALGHAPCVIWQAGS